MLSPVTAQRSDGEPRAQTNARVRKLAAQKCYRCQRCSCSLICNITPHTMVWCLDSFNSALETWLGTVRTSVQGPGYMHGHGQPSGLGCHTVTIQWQPQGVWHFCRLRLAVLVKCSLQSPLNWSDGEPRAQTNARVRKLAAQKIL